MDKAEKERFSRGGRRLKSCPLCAGKICAAKGVFKEELQSWEREVNER